MPNDMAKKIPFLAPVLFAVFDILYIVYFWGRCASTSAAFYCEAFEFGGVLYFLGIPALLLLGIALLAWLIKNRTIKMTLLTGALIIFLFPWALALGGLYADPDQPATYRQWLERRAAVQQGLRAQAEQDCAEYKQYLADHKEGEVLLTPPLGCI